jgi:ABC-type branched-subunit amino acid transport system substrate-binding protein
MYALLLSVFLAQGVTDDAILIGMEKEVQSFSADEENLGMRLVIRHVNASGGIHGRRLVEHGYARDRDNWMRKQYANARRMVEEDGVFLLFNFGGPVSMEIGPYAMKQGVPYMFPHTALLTVDGQREIFTSYPRYDGETAVMLRYLAEDRGMERIGVIYANNAYGQYFASRATLFADELGYDVVGIETLARDADDAAAPMQSLMQLDADAIILALYPAGARKVIEAKQALGWDVQLVSSGPLTDEQYFRIDGDSAEGTLGFCHYPNPTESDLPGIVEYRRLMADYFPGHPVNRYSLYGYVMGSLIVEGLQRAGPDLTRDAFIDAMETIREWDTGGIMPPVSFSPTDHHAQTAGFICEYRDGVFRALTDWIEPQVPEPAPVPLPAEPPPILRPTEPPVLDDEPIG